MLYNASKHLGFMFCTFTIFMVGSHADISTQDVLVMTIFYC